MSSRQDARRQAEQAALLKAVGRTWQEVADELGYRSRQAAQQAAESYQKRNPLASADSVRRSAHDGLRIVRAVLFERFADAKQRDDNEDLIALAKEIRSNVAETAKLHGAYAPQRTEVEVTLRNSPEAIISEARQRLLSVVDAEIFEIPNAREIAG